MAERESGGTVDRVLSVVLTLAALTMAAVAVIRLVLPGKPPELPPGVEVAAERFASWQDAIPHSIFVGGDSTAAVTILEFADLECPVCRGFEETMAQLLSERGTEFQFRYVSYPLVQHRFALPAARALECADSLGKAPEWIRTVYKFQDSLGLKPWEEFAKESGIAETDLVTRCAQSADLYPRIEAGRKLAGRVGIRGTPTVLINGWKFTGALSFAFLDSTVTALSRQ